MEQKIKKLSDIREFSTEDIKELSKCISDSKPYMWTIKNLSADDEIDHFYFMRVKSDEDPNMWEICAYFNMGNAYGITSFTTKDLSQDITYNNGYLNVGEKSVAVIGLHGLVIFNKSECQYLDAVYKDQSKIKEFSPEFLLEDEDRLVAYKAVAQWAAIDKEEELKDIEKYLEKVAKDKDKILEQKNAQAMQPAKPIEQPVEHVDSEPQLKAEELQPQQPKIKQKWWNATEVADGPSKKDVVGLIKKETLRVVGKEQREAFMDLLESKEEEISKLGDKKIYELLDHACEVYHGLMYYNFVFDTVMETTNDSAVKLAKAFKMDFKANCPSYAKRIKDLAATLNDLDISSPQEVVAFLPGLVDSVPCLLNEALGRGYPEDSAEIVKEYQNRSGNSIDELIPQVNQDILYAIKHSNENLIDKELNSLI